MLRDLSLFPSVVIGCVSFILMDINDVITPLSQYCCWLDFFATEPTWLLSPWTSSAWAQNLGIRFPAGGVHPVFSPYIQCANAKNALTEAASWRRGLV